MNQLFGKSAIPFRLHFFAIAFVAVTAIATAMTGFAQDELGGDPVDEAPPAVVEDVEIVGEVNDAPANNAGGGGGAEEPQSALGWVYESLGLGYVLIFLALSFTLVSLLVMNLLASRRDNLVPQELIDGFEEKLNEKDFQSAYDMARTDESVLGQVLSAGLAKLSRGYNRALESMQEVGEEESMKLDHRLSYMALIGNLSPMIGLFGTVHGMIRSFQVIALSGATPEPAKLAGGISTALLTTLVGLAIAIPALAAYNILRNRVARLLLEVGVSSENLMSRFEDVQPQAAKK
ncbi:Biopolymer transport protein ExbB [Roseimaritima multifibrata]|uniref:Biopolymer transport protein ExbB n=1 Tax=Roseimaritima multifibrata TaxID=1930274 RepID=A0A517MK15_9BACT|nr:Biopolymer transport protein ExbB [Roseimaritima multifibrata]